MSIDRVGFTGTQIGMSQLQKDILHQFLWDNVDGEFHHGDCIGADAEADEIARSLGYEIHIHPPIISSKRAFCYRAGDVLYPTRQYIERNHDIVDMSDILIAAPKSMEEELRSGTWATIRYARKLGKKIVMLER